MKKRARDFWNQTFLYFEIRDKGVWACVSISPLQSWKRLRILRSDSIVTRQGCMHRGSGSRTCLDLTSAGLWEPLRHGPRHFSLCS